MMHGTVYAMRGGSWVKVGFTTDLSQRFEHLSLNVPFRLSVILAEPGSRFDEELLLRSLAQFRTRGEWFRWTKPVAWMIDYIGRRGISSLVARGNALLDDLCVYR
jgi:hypothetical protein